jgi:hypothetical protein
MIRSMKGAAALLAATLATAPYLSAPADGASQANEKTKDGWVSLFNGKDLKGWDTWLGVPNGEKQPVGLNKDPQKVYTVATVDGKTAIRISGEVFGALTSEREYENYHLKLEFKWGEKRWPPRANTVRDSGLLYHCVGPHGVAGPRAWMRSQECQIQEHDCGDYWSVAGGIVSVEGVLKKKGGPVYYKKGGEKLTVPTKETGPRIIKGADHEHPTGEWNTIELYTVGGTSVHVVNGKVVMVLTQSRQFINGMEVPLTRGKIQIQSEGAEVYYRNIAIRGISEIPKKLLE